MSAAFNSVQSGRAAAIARRQALSAGKAALPPAAERVRNGERSATLPGAVTSCSPAAAPVPPALPAHAPAPAAVTTPATEPSEGAGIAGRLMSMLRRRRMSGGKQALLAAAASSPAVASAAAAPMASAAGVAPAPGGTCREPARARRAELSQRGRGNAPPALPSRPPRQGTLEFAPKVVESPTHGGQRVTGLRIGRGAQVTGDEPGATLPVSGTQYIGSDAGAPVRSGGPKVGQSRTAGGLVVSGTLVRSKVQVTGDEAGDRVTITGEAEQRLEDDLTLRSDAGASAMAQFKRQSDPHGHSVFGTNLGRSAGSVGSRQRDRQPAIESSEGGLAITGSAIGRSVRVTGDEDGACRAVTGDQYLTPARRQAECAAVGGNNGGGTAPAPLLGAPRRDPVTGAKVGVAQTWGSQRVTGADLEHNPRVTGDEPGSCSAITGTPYQGPATVQGWCDPAAGAAAERRLPRRTASAGISGDAPVHDGGVTGTARGAGRDITGTPYYREPPAAAAPAADPADPVAAVDARFSVTSPQRAAQLCAASASTDEDRGASGRITGSFACGQDKITGNTEFLYRPRAGGDGAAAHLKLTGEGRSEGLRITGGAWGEQSSVTGTEGRFAAARNPSERGGKPQAFAGAMRFKEKAVNEEPKQLVTGMFGWSSKSAAKVTLSGGAHG